MKFPRWTNSGVPPKCTRAALLLLIVLSAAWSAVAGSGSFDHRTEQAIQAERSREAGLLTDWHFLGRYGRSGADLARSFDPERWPNNDPRLREIRYDLLFPEGTFVLPEAMSGQSGVFYALARVYLTGSGEWNLFLESGAEAVVFVDGRQVLARGANHRGTLRETFHAESGFHQVMVKFVAQAAPFRIAVLPPNSGSRRKNNTPHLHGTEDLSARLQAPLPTKRDRV